VVLLTHATIAHLAAFAHCCKHFPLFKQIPVYATNPVISLGRTLLQDLYTSTPLAATCISAEAIAESSFSLSQAKDGTQTDQILLEAPTSEEIASYFTLINPLKYSQPHQPTPSSWSPPLGGLTITAYSAGHTLGGTIWHIQHGLESIVHAVDWHHGKEHVFKGAAWLGQHAGGAEVIEQLQKPTALICSSRTAQQGAIKTRDERLLDMIKSAASKGGIVLIPTDTSGRVLELAYLLEHAWRSESKDEDSPLRTSKLYLASKNIGATMRYARSMLEWMDEGMVQEFEGAAGGNKKQNGTQDGQQAGAGPFDFKHLRLLERKNQIDRILGETDNLGRSVGKVILASDSSMEWGFSKEVLRKIADDRRNLVILTEKMSKLDVENPSSGVARTLYSWWEEKRDGVAMEKNDKGVELEQVYAGGREIELREATRSPLEGDDLARYQQWLATQRQLQTTQSVGATSLETSADVIEDASSDSESESDDSEDEQQGKALNISATMGQANRKKLALSDEDLGVNILLRKKGVYDYDVRGKKGREKMFPVAIRRKKNDEFGELIRPEDYLRADERDEIDGQDVKPGRFDKGALGQKRKWDDGADLGKNAKGGNKRQQTIKSERRSSLEPSAIAPGPEDEASDEEAEDEITGPSKLAIAIHKISIDFRIAFVDFAGLHDKRSLQMLIPLIQPRKLILVSGMKEETLALAADCKRLLAARSGNLDDKSIAIFTPEIGETIDASVDTNSWSVKLTDALVKRLRWQDHKGLGIVTLSGRLEAALPALETSSSEESSKKKQKLLMNEEIEVPTQQALTAVDAKTRIPVLDVLPLTMASATRSVAQPLHVGDLKLPDLRKILQTSGHTAEFRGEGILLVDGSVMVRKTGTGRIEVESVEVFTVPLMRDVQKERSTFYAVKSRIYEGLAVIAGG